ncbi:hypothetical protein K7432_007704 [Basidiobolus ranarum]|uniref:Uncharacterized protein n=1 Tax=Basidiobolus ranarum TaxID=34480 RepID=A0ABR2WT41_9FUNG
MVETHATNFGNCGISEEAVVQLNHFLDEFLNQLVRIVGYELVDIDRLSTSISFQFAFNSLGSRCIEEGKKSMKLRATQGDIQAQLTKQDLRLLKALRNVTANEYQETSSIKKFRLSRSVKYFLKIVIATLGQYVVHSMVLMAGKSTGEMLNMDDLFLTLCEDDQLKGMFLRMKTRIHMEKLIVEDRVQKALDQEITRRLRSSSAPPKSNNIVCNLHTLLDPANFRSTPDPSDSIQTTNGKNKGLAKVLRSICDNVQMVNFNYTNISQYIDLTLTVAYLPSGR